MEWIVEDVVAVVNGDWEAVTAILILELDAVRGVVGIRDFTVYVCDGDGRHVNARDSQDYFILQGLIDFGMRQTCPKTF